MKKKKRLKLCFYKIGETSFKLRKFNYKKFLKKKVLDCGVIFCLTPKQSKKIILGIRRKGGC